MANIRIGLSLPYNNLEELLTLQNVPEEFELLEFSGEIAADAAAMRSQLRLLDEFEFFNFRNLMSPSLTSLLSDENPAIINEYKKQLRQLMSCAHSCNAEYFSIDPDWEMLAQDDAKRRVFDDILRSTAGDREYYQQTLALAVRMPGSGAIPALESISLLHKLANYRVKLALDINPHELLKSNVNWPDLLRHFRFDTACIRFCYSSELGNKLLYQHIEPVVEAIKCFRQDIDFYIAPSGRADLEELATMVRKINLESDAR